MAVPIMVVAVPAAVIGVNILARAAPSKQQGARGALTRAQQFQYQTTCAAIVLLLVAYKAVSAAIMQVFDCYDDQILGHTYLRADFGVRCDADAHAGVSVAAGVFIFLYLAGIPLAGYLHLRRNVGRLRDPTFMRYNAFMYNGYSIERHKWGWEMVVIVRKVIIGLISVFVRDPFSQVYVGSCLVLHLLNAPYDDAHLNNLETISLASSYVTQMGSILYWNALSSRSVADQAGGADAATATAVNSSEAVGAVVTVVLSVVNLGTFLLLVRAAVRMKRTEARLQGVQGASPAGRRSLWTSLSARFSVGGQKRQGKPKTVSASTALQTLSPLASMSPRAPSHGISSGRAGHGRGGGGGGDSRGGARSAGGAVSFVSSANPMFAPNKGAEDFSPSTGTPAGGGMSSSGRPAASKRARTGARTGVAVAATKRPPRTSAVGGVLSGDGDGAE